LAPHTAAREGGFARSVIIRQEKLSADRESNVRIGYSPRHEPTRKDIDQIRQPISKKVLTLLRHPEN
jgi:hypothetical protein